MAGSGKVNNRKPYNGDRRALVLAFDVGTTFSGVSYAFLDPGEVPKIHGVTRYPGQEHTGNTKIPSLLYYDRSGNVVAAGAEAENGQIAVEAEDEGWTRVELFKLRLRPRHMELDMNGMRLSPLPPGKSSEDVFGDFLAYLLSCTRKFIQDTHANGKNLWKVVEKDIQFVLSHPNGWEGAQQSRMRRSAISGGLIPNTDEGKARIRFVTEGEASMHACILSGLAHDVLASGNGFIVADAGGGTLDVSSYILRGTHPLQIEEIAPPDCVFSGAVFVSRRCRVFLAEKLKTSKYGTSDTLDHITKRFDETTKRLFRDKHDPQYIPFGSPLDKDPKVGIRGGQLKLTGAEVAELFEPSIQAAVTSIRKQIDHSRGTVKAVWLVGGFAASPWLFSQLQARLAPYRVTVNRPDNQTSKAVADGAIGFFCDHHVSARMSRYMYGVEYLREIDVNDQEHVTRSGRQLQLPSGPKYLPDAFDCILAKNVRVKESSVFSRKYYTEVTKLTTLSVFEIEIWCYRGGETIPKWIDRNSEEFGSLCFVRADLSKLSNSAEPRVGASGQTYWTVVFSIEIHFGLTEFKARMKWNEDGKTRYGPASIVFNEKGVRSDEDDAYSIADGDQPVIEAPRRPYGSLVSHSREPSTTTRSSRHRDRDRGMHREHSHATSAPRLSSTGMSRSMSGQTDAASVETITRDPSSSSLAPPIVNSVSGSIGGRDRSRGLGSSAPSVHEPESEPVFEPPPPSVHSRAPSLTSPPSMQSRSASTAAPLAMHSRTPSMAAPPSVHSRTASVAAPPSMHSRTPSVAASPSLHSRVPSVAVAPSMHSRAPSVTAPPSMHSRAPSVTVDPPSVHSRTPSVAHVPSPVPSRAPSATAVPSRTPSVVQPPSPVPSRTASALERPSVSRAPSSGSRVPTVTRQPSNRSGYGSRAASQMASLDEGDLYVPTEPDLTGAAAEYFGSAPSGGLDAGRSRSRSISPVPPAVPKETFAAAEDPPPPPSKRNSWTLPPVSEVPAEEKKEEKKSKGWGSFGGLSSFLGGASRSIGEPTGPTADTRDIPLSTFDNIGQDAFIPPAPGADSWEELGDPPSAPGGWGAEPPAAPPTPAEPPVIPDPESVAPAVTKTSSGRSGKNKKMKGILKNENWEEATDHPSAPGGWDMESPAAPPAPAESSAIPDPEPELVAPAVTKTNSGRSGKNKKPKGILKNGSANSKVAEAEAKAKAEEEARERAEAEARERAEVEEREKAEAEERVAQEQADAFARQQAEMEARARADEEARYHAQMEEEQRLQAEANDRAREQEAREHAEYLSQLEADRIEAEARARAEREQAEAEAREEAEAKAAAEATYAKEKAEAEEAAAKAKAEEEEEAAARAKAEAEAAGAVTQNNVEESGAGAADEGAAGAPDSVAAATSAVDEEKAKLEGTVEKAEAEVTKCDEEVNRCEVAVVKLAPKGKAAKNKNKKTSPALQSAERALAAAESALSTAKEKFEKAKAALDAYVPPTPPAAAAPSPAPVATDDIPPISKVSSSASGKGKKGIFDFGFGGLDSKDADGEGLKNGGEESKEEGLWGGGGGGWSSGLGSKWAF